MQPKLLRLFLFVQLAVTVFALNDYFFEFGKKEGGELIYTKEGETHWFQYNSHINIPVPPNMTITYVSVRLNSINPPKVDYDGDSQTVLINYSMIQVPLSSYTISVKGRFVGTG